MALVKMWYVEFIETFEKLGTLISRVRSIENPPKVFPDRVPVPANPAYVSKCNEFQNTLKSRLRMRIGGFGMFCFHRDADGSMS